MAGVAASIAALLAGSALLAGCGDQAHVDGFHVESADRGACREIVAALPDTVAGESRRDVSGSAYAAAWGDPAIVLRCGPPLPADVATDPCITRDGIGWSVPADQADGEGDEVVMTLVFRTPVLQVRLPGEYRPHGPGEVMADLDEVVRARTASTGRDCT